MSILFRDNIDYLDWEKSSNSTCSLNFLFNIYRAYDIIPKDIKSKISLIEFFSGEIAKI